MGHKMDHSLSAAACRASIRQARFPLSKVSHPDSAGPGPRSPPCASVPSYAHMAP